MFEADSFTYLVIVQLYNHLRFWVRFLAYKLHNYGRGHKIYITCSGFYNSKE